MKDEPYGEQSVNRENDVAVIGSISVRGEKNSSNEEEYR